MKEAAQLTMTGFILEVGQRISPATVKSLEQRGVISPRRDSAGRRVFGVEEVKLVRSYLAKRRKK